VILCRTVVQTDTRGRILDAALECFLSEGYERATVALIRSRSGVSNGALFHHFPSKEAIADALYVEAIVSFQEGMWELVHSDPRTLRAAVRGAIGHQMRWVEANPDRARFVYGRGHLEWDSPAASTVAALNRDLAVAVREWLAPRIEAREIRPKSLLVITAIVSGPAHAIARRWLAGQLRERPTKFVDSLADAACAGLREIVAVQPPTKEQQR
jgi:AcrR family transcriptional regulator